jgi:hypothetical protein
MICIYQAYTYVYEGKTFEEALDGPSNGFYGIMIVVWGVMFLESWKNREKMIAFQWDTES